MKKLLNVVLCAVVSMTMGVPSVQAGSNPKGKPFVAINDQIVEVKGSVSSLQEQIEILAGRVDTMEERVTANEQAITNLNEQNAALQVLANSSLTNIEDIIAEIALVQNDNANINAQIAALAENDPAITALQAEVSANASMIATLEGSVLMVQDGVISLETTLQEQVDANLELQVMLSDEIARIEGLLAEKQNMIDGKCPDGEAAKEITPDGSIVCGPAGAATSGEIEIDYSFKGAVAGPAGSANQTVTATAYCSEGYYVSSAGFNQAGGMFVLNVQTSSSANSAYVVAQNTKSSNNFITAVASCIRIAP